MISWVTVIWSMTAAACLTLGAIYLLVWNSDRRNRANLLFSVTAIATAALAFNELTIMRADTPAEVLTALTWNHLPIFVWLVGTTWFVKIYLNAGRPWLAWTICALRAGVAVVNLAMGQSQRFRPLSALQHMNFLGESITVIGRAPNRLTPFTQLVTCLVLVFVADAGLTAWRRGDRRRALTIAGSAEFFVGMSLGTAVAVLWGNAQIPIVFSLYYVGLVAVMGYELSRDVVRASQLVRELRLSEAGLRENEARMALAVEAGDFGIWIWMLAQQELWASESWRALFGFSSTAPLLFDEVLQRVHPDDRAMVRLTQTTAIAGANGGRYQTEYRLRLPDGAIRWIASQARLEHDEAGQPLLIRGVSRDVTARKQIEQETQRLQQELAHAGRVSMMGQLASALAHEINQPLTAILSNAEAAERYLQHPSPDIGEVRAILTDIRSADKRASTVIERMRGLLRRHTVETQPLDVGALVAEVAALVRVDAVKRRVQLQLDVPAALPLVRGDRVHLQQVLLNLILNGMDALNGNDGPDARRVSVSARLDGARLVEVSVTDAGPGIPAGTLAQIFTPFFTTKPDGMGVGLAISRTIVEAHGGRLWAENMSGSGAAFRFTLQVAERGDKELTGDQEARRNSFS